MLNTQTQAAQAMLVMPVKSDWQTGFDLYIAGKSEKHCINRGQVEGWWYANHCAGCAAMVDAQQAAQRESYEDWRYPVRQGF